MELINTIEINPYDFMDSDDPELNHLPEDGIEFWRACISHRGLGRLKPVSSGSYLVDVNTINDAELAEILKNELEDVDLMKYGEQVGRISGGVVLSLGDKIYISPNCCGDMGDLAGWEAITRTATGEWKQLWIGHPWVYYRVQGEMVEFSDYTEHERTTGLSILVTVSRSELVAELALIRLEQDQFEKRVQRVLEKMEITHSGKIAAIMMGHH
ncbi:hypothetical protein [Chitinophaga sp.]|uniref:hypothetical protein n=1 Tax=Chitinophaga sp. TaxID=1869181 RepID=UPI0031E46680